MRQRLTLIVLLASSLLGACGTRGPLTLPPPKSKAAFAHPATLTSIDLNTAKVRS
jgi:predicted small lipoprotein YifL